MKTERLYTVILLIGYLTAVYHFKLVSCKCRKLTKSTTFLVPGYIAKPVHIDQCRETVTSSIFPVVSINATEMMMYQRTFTRKACCCVVGAFSLHEEVLNSLDGRLSISLTYKRIKECWCIPCPEVKNNVTMEFVEPKTLR